MAIDHNVKKEQEDSLPDRIGERSEEVQAIIDRMPTYWVKWVVFLVSVLMGIIVLLGFLIQYPDTVDGQISVTANHAPVRLVANSNGRIILLKRNKDQLRKGDVIGYIENGANYKHLLMLDSMLTIKEGNATFMPDSLLLGEVSSSYNAFMLAYLQYERLRLSDTYATMRKSIQRQIQFDEAVVANLKDEAKLKKQILQTSADRLHKDSLLFAANGISEQDFQQQHNTYLSLQEACFNQQSNELMKQSEVAHNQLELQRIILEETEAKEKAYSELMSRKNELINNVSIWKEHYLLYSPVEGTLEYLGFWRDNSYIQAGQEIFSIMPDKNDIIGEVVIPALGAGKVELGQTVNVKINNYPYDEYGLMKGIVKSVSRMTNKLKAQNGDMDAYLIVVSFPNGMKTNFGKTLPIDFESKGTAEIITKRKRLIERLFDNLKSKGEK